MGHYANSTEYDGTPYGGFYTQKEIRDIVKYAADRFVTVIPEIELPGHAVAALASYPWLGCRGEGYEVRTRWGVSPEVYCPGKETTFGFLQDVFTEVLELFPSEYIHIGRRRVSEGELENLPEMPAAHQGRGPERRIRTPELHRAPHGEMARRTRPQDHRLGRNPRRRSFTHGYRHVVARIEGRYRRRQSRQPCHHGAERFLLPGLLPDERPDEGAAGHRRIRPGQQILCARPLRWACTGGTALHTRRSGEPLDGIYLHVHTPETHAAAAPGGHRRGGWSYDRKGLRGFQTPHELLPQMLRCLGIQLRHLFLRRQGRIKTNGKQSKDCFPFV